MNNSRKLLQGIGRGNLGRILMAKLSPDIELLEAVRELVQRENIRVGVILSAVGALSKAVFQTVKTFPPNFEATYLKLEKPMEINSLTGWIARREDDQAEIHAHLSVSTVIKDRIVTYGGHITPGTITSFKVVITIGIIDDMPGQAVLDRRINKIDLSLPSV